MPKFIIHNALQPFPLEKGSVNLVVTSPPYFNLRNYSNHPDQIGAESTVAGYVEHMVQVGRNIKEVLAKDGSYYLNIGDSYNNNKCLDLVPHRTAIGMIDDGWILRNTIVWHKPNAMPSSVKDRLNTTHEYVFHFVKSAKYYYNLDAIRVPHQTIDINKVDPEVLRRKMNIEFEGVETPQQEGIGCLLGDLLINVMDEQEQKKGYLNTKLDGQEKINIGARGGFAENGETVENRYADGGKNPGDLFDEVKFTKEDELRAEKEFGYTRHAAARVTARLRMGLAKNHPLGKNPGDVHTNNNKGENTERLNHVWWLDGFTTECPSCGSQFETSASEIEVGNPEDVWHINTIGFPDTHYAVFPPTLIENMIKSSSREFDVVLDPFSGSGTTAITADRLNRNGVGFDLSYEDVRERQVKKGIQQTIDALSNIKEK